VPDLTPEVDFLSFDATRFRNKLVVQSVPRLQPGYRWSGLLGATNHADGAMSVTPLGRYALREETHRALKNTGLKEKRHVCAMHTAQYLHRFSGVGYS